MSYFWTRVIHKNSLYVSFLFFLLSSLFSFLHFSNVCHGSSISLVSWIASTITFIYSFLPQHLSVKKSTLLIFVFVAVLYFISHLLNFSHSPWNTNGLFDDAAWDIYFANNHIFNGTPFQAAFFDNVGYISREAVFHYYISIFFKLFGYNLLVFNISLLILGFITVLFTTLIVQSLFNHTLLTLISAVIINFFPLHFTHIFAGHRYAISAPLMTVSLYFLYSALSNNSYLKMATSGIFAALCVGSSVIGKQYLYGLVLCIPFFLYTQRKLRMPKEKIIGILVWMVGFILAATPLIFYVLFNHSDYNIRERNIIQEFFLQYQNGGVSALQPYLDQIKEVFLSKNTYRRWFLPDFYVIPPAYYLLMLPGLFLAFVKKRFEIVFLAIIPVAAAFFSGAYDFRVLFAVPIWVISMAFSLNWLFRHKRFGCGIVVGFVCVVLGLFPSIKYLWGVSKNPNYFWLLPHKDVAVSRLVQDIVVGIKSPTSSMKWDEFRRKINFSSITYDTLVCPLGAYAIMHLYLQNFDDKKILSFIDQGTQLLSTPDEILKYNTQAIANYLPTNKDLKMVWEVSEKTNDIIRMFSRYNKYGSEEIISDSVDGIPFSLYVLTIKNENLKQFKTEIAQYP